MFISAYGERLSRTSRSRWGRNKPEPRELLGSSRIARVWRIEYKLPEQRLVQLVQHVAELFVITAPLCKKSNFEE